MLERQRGNVMVAMHYDALAVLFDDDTADAALVAENLVDLRLPLVAHTSRLEIGKPGIDPDEIGRPVKHPISGSSCRIHDGEEQLHEDIADGARAGAASLGGHQRARQADREKLLVGFRALLGADEVPPVDLLVLCQPALAA